MGTIGSRAFPRLAETKMVEKWTLSDCGRYRLKSALAAAWLSFSKISGDKRGQKERRNRRDRRERGRVFLRLAETVDTIGFPKRTQTITRCSSPIDSLIYVYRCIRESIGLLSPGTFCAGLGIT